MAALDKKIIRKNILTARKNMVVNEVEDKSQLIFDRIINESLLYDCNVVGIYCDIQNEVQTKQLILTCLAMDKVVALPRVIGDTMEFYQIKSLEELELGSFNVMEPIGSNLITSIDLLFVPVVAFTKKRDRIGYGKGFYDKYLSKKCKTIGLAYEFQKVSFEAETHDKPLDYIITESNIY